MEKKQLLKEISEALVAMEVEKVAELAEKSLKIGILPLEIITEGLILGMEEVTRLYGLEEYCLPEILVCSQAFNAGLEVVKPHLDKKTLEVPIKAVLGVVEGDTHDIGKNLARVLMEYSGFEVHDLGRDVPLDKFIEKAEEINSDIICMSTLMSSTMDGMKTVIDKLKENNIRDKYKVLIGGGPTSQKFADLIGADIYAKDAGSIVSKTKAIMGRC